MKTKTLIIDMISALGKPEASDGTQTYISDTPHPVLDGLHSGWHSDRFFRGINCKNLEPHKIMVFGDYIQALAILAHTAMPVFLDLESVLGRQKLHELPPTSLGLLKLLIKRIHGFGLTAGLWNYPMQSWWPDVEKFFLAFETELARTNELITLLEPDFLVAQAYSFAADKPVTDRWYMDRWHRSFRAWAGAMEVHHPHMPCYVFLWQCQHSNGRPEYINRFIPLDHYKEMVQTVLDRKMIPVAWGDAEYVNKNGVVIFKGPWPYKTLLPYIEVLQDLAS